MHEVIGAPLPPVWREDLQRRLQPVRRMLREATYAAVWAEGHGWSVDQAVAYALRPAEGEGGEPDLPSAGRRAYPLTAREGQVAALLARGLTNRQIAEELVIAEATAERHVANILNKLGCHSRAQVAAWAVEQGLLRAPTR
jgi:DNA-binding NarL/FixJ family response regulator